MDSLKKPGRAARPGTGGITLNDVAKLAGVSAITVSRALNTPAAVSPDTLERVRGAIARSGYVPNLVAGGLASNRSRLVAALVPTIAGPVFLETIQALTDALAEAGCQLMLGQSGYGGAREDALLDAIIGRRPDGIVLIGIMHSAEGRRRLLASGIPVVETWDITPTPLDMIVGFSHEKVGAAVADYLHGRGFHRPGIVSASDERATRRRVGFEQRFAELGVPGIPACVVPSPSSLGNGRAGFAELRASHPGLDVVFCSSDVIAHGVITEAHATGLRVPEDIAVMGFGDLPFAAFTYPQLSTVSIDGTAIGRQAANFILDRVANRDVGPPVRDIGFSIIQRGSA
ncbi:LacI family DNA-binding transcriptional regulator [Polaromonas sp. JS666]|uniref:LacI family DNA-binding transcriptional regulator n=1 Tax=Polaromonas sp. (strain JS666 / ATCC BAA-500) TaxID=296591 RepID=UPI000046490C|nr:LacI family DNA-binding transcriptional regulator [Polaromonas sp. JS666]ABE46413.1 transcriptional regulator, LacI family [Polaromonas sp. JS666]